MSTTNTRKNKRHFCAMDTNPTGRYSPCSVEASWMVDGDYAVCGTHKNKWLHQHPNAEIVAIPAE